MDYETGTSLPSLFTKLCQLASDGQTNSRGVPSLLQAAVIASAYRGELRVTRPSWLVQRTVVFGVLAPIGRLLGHRASPND